MANYGAVYLKFWTDADVIEDYTKEDKYFFLYCLCNPHIKLCGCYEISIGQMAYEMGDTRENVERLIERFQTVHKSIFYNRENKELFVKNWWRYHANESPKVDVPLRQEILNIKTEQFKSMLIESFNERTVVKNGKSEKILESDLPTGVEQIPMDDFEEMTSEEVPEEKNAPEEPEQLEMMELSKPEKGVTPTRKTPPYDAIAELYHSICISYPKLKTFTDARRTHVSARWKETGCNIEVFKDLFCKMQESNFLKGQNKDGWQASFDWAMKPNNFTKILEGNYVNKTGARNANAPGSGWDYIRQVAQGVTE